jgi:hypothetical protein
VTKTRDKLQKQTSKGVNKGWSETTHFPPNHEATKIGLGWADIRRDGKTLGELLAVLESENYEEVGA